MRVIYVDDEQPARDNFYYTVSGMSEIDSLKLFSDGNEALEYICNNPVDVAFLDMEMPGLHGLALALRIKEISKNIRVVFVTAFSNYALDAWKVNANGYVMKPYAQEDIRNELEKCIYRPLQTHHVVIQTIPNLAITIDRKALMLPGEKVRELFALLVDKGDSGLTVGEGIAYLWPERESDSGTQSLFRMTYKRLADSLEEAGIGNIIVKSEKRRYIRMEEVDCDLYRILSGDKKTAEKYEGAFLEEYSWAEQRNSQLFRMIILHKEK